jgi:siroheme synthase-like protein
VPNRFALPVSLDVAGRRCLILGGGPEATDKAGRLVRAGAVVQVIAEEVDEPVGGLGAGGVVGGAARGWVPADLKNAYLVYVTPEERDRAEEAHQLALANGAQICAIDEPDQCTFANPAVVEVGELRLALSSGGRTPSLLRRLREDLQRALVTDRMKAFVAALAQLRDETPEAERRRRMGEAVAGFRLDIRVEFPAWFEAQLAEEEAPSTEREPFSDTFTEG